jgi:hypothetical protein
MVGMSREHVPRQYRHTSSSRDVWLRVIGFSREGIHHAFALKPLTCLKDFQAKSLQRWEDRHHYFDTLK